MKTASELFEMFKEENLINDRREYDVEDLMSTYGLSEVEAIKLEDMVINYVYGVI
jgi:hypothetical protein